jgi:translocation protein SEC63
VLTTYCFCAALQTPSLACVEMMQCLAQALPVAVRKGGGKAGDSLAPLLQLPGFDQELLKKLRKRKLNSLAGGGQGDIRGG